jgi:hypothetical protein
MVMFLLDTALWIIDIHDAVSELQTTLTSSSDDSLEDRFASLGTFLLSVDAVLFLFMVRMRCLNFMFSPLKVCISATLATPL